MAREGAIFAIEKNAHDIEICQKNMKKFRADFTLVHGRAPEHLEQFPDPDAVFIGGTSGSLRDIVAVCCARLKQGGRIVVNAVTIETLYEAMEAFRQYGYHADILLAQFSRSKPILQLTRFDALNPIYIISARKDEKMIGKLYGIGVGPGDPELLTVKAFRRLKEADVIAYPKRQTAVKVMHNKL